MRLLLLLCFLPCLVQAQITIEGQVKDEEQHTVPYAQVLLKHLPDSTLIKTAVTDSAGNFKLYTDAAYPLLLQVMATGYVQQYADLKQNHAPPISIILKLNANELKTVTVLASRPLLERKPDRLIFNVGSSISSIGSDVYDLLKKAPGVRVSDHSGISIAGKNAVSIMIDGKLQQLSSTELAALLRSMSAEHIDKIEVITTPPARYDAQGNAGIINIITKRSAKKGFNGNIGLAYQQRTRGSQRFTEGLNFRTGKLNIYNTGSTSNFDFQSEQKTTVPYGSQSIDQVLNQRNRPFYNRYQFGLDYQLSSSLVFGLQYTIGSTNRRTAQFYNAPVSSAATGIDSTMRTIASEKEQALRHVANLNCEWKIDTTGKKLNIDADYFSRAEDDSRDFNSQSFLPTGTPTDAPVYNRTTARQQLDISSVKADLVLPYKAVELSLGAKASFIHTLSNNHFFNMQSGSYITDAARTNKFDYTENTQAAYISAARTWDKWQAQAGLRLENTQTKAISITTTQTVTRNYLQLFPTAYLQYSLDDDNTFNINYSRRVGRPSYEELNPFRVYGAGGSYRTGNPFLQPSFYHTAELSYSYKSKYTFTAYTGIVNNIHALISRVDTANRTFYFTNDNAGSSLNTGLSATLMLHPAKWWETNIQLQGYYDKVSSTYYNGTPSINGVTAFSGQVNNTFICNRQRTLMAEAGVNYISRFQYDFFVQGAYYEVSAGIRALFFDQKLSLALTGSDIFRTELYKFRNIYNDMSQENYYDARSINCSLNWKFGNNQVKRRQRNTDTEEISRSE